MSDIKLKTSLAIEAFGSPAKLARALKITRSAVSQWGGYVPASSMYHILHLKPELSLKTELDEPEAKAA